MADEGSSSSGTDRARGAQAALQQCSGIIGTVRKRTRKGKTIYRDTHCTNMVDIQKPSGRYCANCLVPSTRRAFDEAELPNKDVLVMILRWNTENELMEVRAANKGMMAIVDRVLALRGIDVFFLVRTWPGVVRSRNRLKEAIKHDIAHRGDPRKRINAMPEEEGGVYGPLPAAAQQGLIQAYMYAHGEGYPYFLRHAIMAAANGHTNIILWAATHTDQAGLDHRCAVAAVEENQLGVLKFLKERLRWSPRYYNGLHDRAVRTPHTDLTWWLLTELRNAQSEDFYRHVWTVELCETALRTTTDPDGTVRKPSVEMLVWLHRDEDPNKWPCKGECAYAREHQGRRGKE